LSSVTARPRKVHEQHDGDGGDLVIERRQGTYGAVKYMSICNVILAIWMDDNDIPNPLHPDKFHSTLIYSRKPIVDAEKLNFDQDELTKLQWIFYPDSLALLDSSSESHDKSVLVMKLKAPELVDYHNFLIKSGATHDFDDYIPHITLSYDVPTDFNLDILMP
jgi:hypothetical protein